MDKELLEAVALAQRNYWRSLAREQKDFLGSQADPVWQGKYPDFDSFTARDWASFWNQYVDPAKSF